jgi:tRNA threonylcarbamoyl adenosine modification protein YjeE
MLSHAVKHRKPFVVLLHGEMGAGKTTFVRDVLKKIVKNTTVTSPTFTIINQYAENIFHADLYRIKDKTELENTDFFEILYGDNVFFIEWAFNNVDKSIYKNIKFGMNVTIKVVNGKRKIMYH